MKQIDIETRKQIQLDILQAIHDFCSTNNIRYSLGYGTLLGAIRHGGYIPWDDDIDIVMLREDYDRFVESFHQDRYKVASFTTIDNWYLPFAKVYDDKTVIVDRKANTTPIGINVDVFPIDDAMESEEEFKAQRAKIKRLTTCNNIKLFKINKDSTLKNNTIALFAKLILLVFPKFYFVKRLIKVSQQYNHKGCTNAVYWASVGRTTSLKKCIYEDLCEIKFEDKFFSSLRDYDTYLTNIYCDYMKLPPVEKRISYHTSDAYWK